MADSSDSEESGMEPFALEFGGVRVEDSDTNEDQPMDEHDQDESSQIGMEEANFDPALATQHSYLGRGEEMHGRTVFEEGTVVEMPLLYDPSVMLVPGQTLPLTMFHPASIAMVRRVVDTNRTFGFVKLSRVEDFESPEGTIGTTAEIYEMKEESEDSYTGFVVKAKGRQRFKILSTRSQVDGTKVGRVRILCDVLPESPWTAGRCRSLWRLALPPPAALSVTECASGGRLVQVAAPRPDRAGQLARYQTAGAPWPAWLYSLYDVAVAARVARFDVQRCVMARPEVIPADPTELSYWVAMNLPLEDSVRLQLLRLDSVLRRLRCEISIMRRFKLLSCSECQEPIASSDDVFAMSADGPQSIFVNPNGHLHETLTLYRATGLLCITRPSREFSWFPGYAWEIAQCERCSKHMGWRFTATSRRLRPQIFWGLCRKSLTPRMDDSESEEVFIPVM